MDVVREVFVHSGASSGNEPVQVREQLAFEFEPFSQELRPGDPHIVRHLVTGLTRIVRGRIVHQLQNHVVAIDRRWFVGLSAP